MSAPRNPIVLIPARLASVRLPDKPLADIHGEPMIVHVWRRAMEADVGPVLVACGEAAIAEAIRAVGGRAVLTRPGHPTGSDRIFEGLQQADPQGTHDAVVNLQGDLPTLDPKLVRAVLSPLATAEVEVGTIATAITREVERDDPNVVKVVATFPAEAAPGAIGRALYFSRARIPSGEGPNYHHIGIYAYRRPALERFVTLPRGVLEQRERLEQLRALEAGMRIDVACVDAVPLGVDTPGELERARSLLAPRSADRGRASAARPESPR